MKSLAVVVVVEVEVGVEVVVEVEVGGGVGVEVVVVVGVVVWVGGVEVDAINDTAAVLFSFFMHLVVICSSISHMFTRLLEDVVFGKQVCS